jgi:hypothetical protein
MIGSGRTVKISIVKESDPDLSEGATLRDTTLTISLLSPPAIVRFSAGLALMDTPAAHYPVYATRVPATGGPQLEIYQSSVTDQRITWGLVAGATWRWCDGLGHLPLSLWLPELTVGDPTSSTQHELGIGGAISFGFFKLGAGSMWVRHTKLDTLGVGAKIPNAGFLLQRDTYGHGNLFVSISLVGIAPFTIDTPK